MAERSITIDISLKDCAGVAGITRIARAKVAGVSPATVMHRVAWVGEAYRGLRVANDAEAVSLAVRKLFSSADFLKWSGLE